MSKGCFLIVSPGAKQAYKSIMDAPEGICKCGSKGYALMHDYATGIVECMCREHFAIAKLQIAMRGIKILPSASILIPHPPRNLAGVIVTSIRLDYGSLHVNCRDTQCMAKELLFANLDECVGHRMQLKEEYILGMAHWIFTIGPVRLVAR